jgi:hypothetical protein
MNAIAARQTVRRIAIAGSFLTLLTTFGCGSDDSSAEDPAASSSSSAGTPSAPAGGMDPEQLQEIQACLEAAGIDSERYTGWAFGMGPGRIAMSRYGIPDIRLLYDSDVRFLEQLAR